jgi:hypothetical protein
MENAAIKGRKLVRRKTVVEEFATDSESDSSLRLNRPAPSR